MAEAGMDLLRFRQIVEAYGGEPSRWPEAERESALALLEGSAEARAARDDAGRLDALLDRAPRQAPSAALIGAVMAARPRSGSRWRSLFVIVPGWQPVAVLMLAAVLGLGLGATGTLIPADGEAVLVDVALLDAGIDPDEGEVDR